MHVRPVLVTAVLVLVACGSTANAPVGTEGGKCRPDDSCDSGLLCVDGVCAASVLADASARRPDAHVVVPSLDAPPRGDARLSGDAPSAPDAPAAATDAPPGALDAGMPPDAPVVVTGAVHVTWEVRIDGALASCQAVGGVTALVTARSAGDAQVVASRFPCSSGSGTLSGLVPAGYTVDVALLDASDHDVTGTTVSASVVGGQTAEVGPVIFAFTNQGTFSATWAVIIGDQEASCADAGATKVTIESTSLDTGEHLVDVFFCDDGGGTTFGLPEGRYHVTVRLEDDLDDVLAHVDLPSSDIVAGQDTALGDILFFVPPAGGRIHLSWSLRQGASATTCAAVGAAYVEIDEVPIGGGTTFVDLFDCVGSSDAGTTAFLEPGLYDVSVFLRDANLDTLNFVVPGGAVPVDSGATTDIGEIIFEF